MRVEGQAMLMGEWGKRKRLILAGGHLAELVAGGAGQLDDVVLNHSQTLITRVDTAELHQLVNQFGKTQRTSTHRLHSRT